MDGSNVVSIQRGATIYTFSEGDAKGKKETLQRRLGTLGLIRQIEVAKTHGNRETSEIVAGSDTDIYVWDVNAPGEMAIVYLSKETS